MARDGSGTYTNPYPNFVAGTTISSDQVDANNTQIATALTQSIAVDGQSTVTGNIPMSSKKFTGLAVGNAATDSLSLGQAQAEAFIWCGTMGGSADAGTLSPAPAITAYAAGQRFAWKASTNTNTGAMTVAISGLSTIAVQNDRAALTAGDHAASDIFMGLLDTTSTMQIIKVANDATAGDVVGPGSATADSLAKFSGTTGKLLKNGAVIGTDVQAYNADTLFADVDDVLTAGFSATAADDGTKSSGTYIPATSGGNYKQIVGGGGFILAPQTTVSSIVIQLTNNASAGTITTSGFDKVSGDALTTTNGNDFMLYLCVIGGFQHLHVVALQ
tara:strand:- start:1594 stop:2586 length:993 start_codon:yes stop_codon:yes gene_type:complete